MGLCGDRGCRLEYVVRVMPKELQQTGRRGCSARFFEPELAGDAGLKRRTEAVLGASNAVVAGLWDLRFVLDHAARS